VDDEIPLGGWRIDPEVRSNLRLEGVRAAAGEGRWGDVVLEAEELLDEEPDHPDALFLLAEAMLELGEPELAAAAYAQRARLGDEDPAVLLGLGLASYELCNLPRAIECFREVVRQRGDHAEAHFSLALALEAAGRDAEAAASFQAAQLLEPEHYPPPMELAPAAWRTALTEAVASLAPPQQALLNQVPVQLVDQPDLEELRANHPPLPPSVACLLDGDPGDGDVAERPAGLRVFTRVLARQPTFDDLVFALAHALNIETADWLGLELVAPEDAPSPD